MSQLPRGEQRRLSSDEADWNLIRGVAATTRTRGGANPGARKRYDLLPVIDLEDDDNEGTDESMESNAISKSSSEGDDESTEAPESPAATTPTTKPTHTRVLLEVSQLEQAFRNYPCPDCGEHLELNLRTVCIATCIRLVCNNSECSYICNFDKPSTTTMHVDDRGDFERMTDYAVNVIYVLGFISMGDAHTEAGRLLGLLGLPNDTTMMNRSFGMIEERVGPYLRAICSEIISDNIHEEAKLSMSEVDYNVWKAWQGNSEAIGDLPSSRWPQLEASYDMAWQQKGSGNVYNSQSGHGTLFGRHSRKVIGLVIKSKLCSFCNTFTRRNPEKEVPTHVCWKNHEGSSGSMESSGAVQVLVDAFEQKKVVICRVCCDDDSSIRADCQWSNADYLNNNNTDVLPMVKKTHGKNKGELQTRPDKGKLPRQVPEPVFVADPNHRRKGLTGELIKLDLSKADTKMTMTRMDSTRIGKNFGYMARTLKNRPQSEYINAAKACLEHHFDDHVYCGDWCKRKAETVEQRERMVRYYRCKEKDAKLYALLATKLERFITLERLVEMGHGLDTNMNEAFNQICTWFAPKNKVFAGTGSLHNRIAFAVAINSVGIEVFFKRLFKKLGIPLTKNVAYYLSTKEKSRVKRLTNLKTRAAKQKKNQRKYEKLQEATKQAKKEFHRRQGTYRKGMNLDDPYGEVLNGREEDNARKPKSKKGFCEYCGRSDHLTKKSKKCRAPPDCAKMYCRENGSLLSETNPVVAPVNHSGLDEAGLAQQDCEMMDAMPFDADYDSDIDLLALALAMDGESDDDEEDDHHCEVI